MSSIPSSTAPYAGRFNLHAVQTPGQTLGPFFHQGLLRGAEQPFGADLFGKQVDGQRLTIVGRVLDGLNRPVGDALLEIWQADAQGIYPHPLDTRSTVKPGFLGFGRTATNDSGAFAFKTIKPGCVPGPQGLPQASHINLIVGARGLMRHAFTRIYFADDAALATDPILQHVPEERRMTLLANPENSSLPGVCYRFDVHLQGPLETVFFDV